MRAANHATGTTSARTSSSSSCSGSTSPRDRWVDFSRHYLPVLDFALAWACAPSALKTQDRVELMMSVEALMYRLEREGEVIRVRSNVHDGRVLISAPVLAELVDRMIEGAFSMLYSHHPELRHNPYLLDLRERLARRGVR
jgi:hypothetical protein